jgi:hypothetical protein
MRPWCALTSGANSTAACANRRQVALPLQHAGKAGEIGLQPILLGVAVGGQPQVVDHCVEVVFQVGNFAARLDLN